MSNLREYTQNLQYTNTSKVVELADKRRKWQSMILVMSDKNLSDSAKVLFFHVYGLAEKGGYCFAPNSFFEEKLGIKKRQLINLFNELETKQYIQIKDRCSNRKIYIAGCNKMHGEDVLRGATNYTGGCNKNVSIGAKNCTSGHIKKKEEKIYTTGNEFSNTENEKEEFGPNTLNAEVNNNNVPPPAALHINNSKDPFILNSQFKEFLKVYDYQNIQNPLSPGKEKQAKMEFCRVLEFNEISFEGLVEKAIQYRKSLDTTEFQMRPDNWLKDEEYLVNYAPKKRPVVRGQVPEQMPEVICKSVDHSNKPFQKTNLEDIPGVSIPPAIREKMRSLLSKKTVNESNEQKSENIDEEAALHELKTRPLIRRK